MDINLESISNETQIATKYVVDLLLYKIHPQMLRIRNYDDLLHANGDETASIRDMFALCCDQVKKCFLGLLDIFRLEHKQHICLQESRQYYIERLKWCMNRLTSIENYFETNNGPNDIDQSFSESLNVTIMYFVNWIDHTLEILAKLGNIVLRTDYRESDALYDSWKDEISECLTDLHVSIDELLLSAMTLCKYCLPSDQHVVKARCQVVLREMKALFAEIVQGDMDLKTKATMENLKLPLMASNISVQIDVLKDALYILETNTNTALLALLIHCFSMNMSPVDVLIKHFNEKNNGTCICTEESCSNDFEDCSFVKEFDLYNERLMQIGSFAVSCSSDKKRILSVRSGSASLEALDPHLVPALVMSADSHHAIHLTNSWRQEVQVIRDSVFLIVDPAAFAEKSKQMMHLNLLELLKTNTYNNCEVCAIINIGCVVYDFFNVYNKYEPIALAEHEKLMPLLIDLNKVLGECKVVSNLLSTNVDFVFEIKMSKNKDVSNDQLLKRLKLLYSVVNRINALLHSEENDINLFECHEEQATIKNVTRTICNNYFNTYANSPRKSNLSRSIFGGTCQVRSSTRNFPLFKFTKRLQINNELNFSVQLHNLLNDESKNNEEETFCINKHLDRVREHSILYNFSPNKNRSSLRKAVLTKYSSLKSRVLHENNFDGRTVSMESEEILDDATSLQITDILTELTDITKTYSTTQPAQRKGYDQQRNEIPSETHENQDLKKNVLTFNINDPNTKITKHIWDIPIKSNTVEMPLDETITNSVVLDSTQPSNVTTLERINDLDLVESKLNSLRSQFETSV